MIKLPENPDDRKKAFIAMALMGAGVLYLAYMFGLQPYQASIRQRKERIAELEDLIWRAEKDLTSVGNVREQKAAVVEKILQRSELDQDILRPSLGNYLLVATDIINTAARGLELQVDSINELPKPPPPQPKKGTQANTPAPPADRFTDYTVNVSLSGGLHDITRFLHRLETDNSHLAITRLIVMAQSVDNPEIHFISLHIQWPIWADEEYALELIGQQMDMGETP